MIVDGIFGIHSIAQEVAHTDTKRTRLDLISLHDVAMTNDTQTRRKTLLFDVESFNSILCLHQQLVILIGDNEYVSISITPHYCLTAYDLGLILRRYISCLRLMASRIPERNNTTSAF